MEREDNEDQNEIRNGQVSHIQLAWMQLNFLNFEHFNRKTTLK